MIHLKRNHYLFLAVIAFSVLIAVLWQPFAGIIIKHSLKEFSKDFVGGEFRSESLYKDGRRWIVKKPFISNALSMQEGGFQLIAEELGVSYHINLWKREIDLDISLINPEIEAGQNFDLKSLLANYCSQPSFFKKNAKISIPQGILLLNANEASEKKPIYLQVALDCQDKLKGHIAFNFEDSIQTKNSFKFQIGKEEENQKKIHFQFRQVDCSKLFELALLLDPAQFSQAEVHSGILDGNLEWDRERKGISAFDGDINLENFSFIYLPSQLGGEIKSALFQLHPKSSQTSIGELAFNEEAKFASYQNGVPCCEIKNLIGKAVLNSEKHADIHFKGECFHHEKPFELLIEGFGQISDNTEASLDLLFNLASQKENGLSVHLQGYQLDKSKNCLKADIRNFGFEEFEILQSILQNSNPINNVKARQGSIDASLMAFINEGKIHEFQINNILAKGLNFDFDPWEMSIQAGELSGDVKLNLQSDVIFDNLDSSIKFSDGKIIIKNDLKYPLELSGISTKLNICKGVIQKSTAEAHFAGLQGYINLDWLSPDHLMTINFQGGPEGLIDFASKPFRKGILNSFEKNQLFVSANLKRKPEGLNCEGTLTVSEGDEKNTNYVHFGFDLKKSLQTLEGVKSHAQQAYVEKKEITDALKDNIENSEEIASIYQLFSKWMQKEAGIAGFVISNGWFKGTRLPLNKFVSPFTFEEDILLIRGFGDILGAFDQQTIFIKYDAKDLVLENSDLIIELGSISQSENSSSSKDFPAEYRIELDKRSSHGFIPVANGSYFEKNSGLLFTDIKANVILDGKKIYIPEIDTFCNGIYFAGAIKADFTPPEKGVFNVDILSHTMNGKMSQLQHLFSHFDKPLFFLKFPLEGNVAFRGGGGHLHFAFKPLDYTLSSHIQGVLTDGEIICQNSDIVLQEVSMDFEYDHELNRLDFSDIQGTLLIGKPDHVEEYSVAGDYIRFVNYANNDAEFDVWVGDKKRDVIRVVGKTRSMPLHNDNFDHVEFILDKDISHFGDVHPRNFQLTLKDWSQIETFNLQLGFSLNTLLHDLQRFSRTGLFFLSRHFLKALNDLQRAQGDFTVDFQYDNNLSQLNYHVTGEDIEVGDHSFKKFVFSGKKKNSSWMIDQIILDDLSLAADLLRTENSWKVNFLGIRYGKSLLMGLEGEYRHDANNFDATVNLLELKLDHLKEWPKLKEISDKMQLKGDLRGTGKMSFEIGNTLSNCSIQAFLNASLHSGEFKGLFLKDAKNFIVNLNTNRGINFQNLDTGFISGKTGGIQALAHLEKVEYDIDHQRISLEGIRFHVPAQNLGWLADNLEQSFPDAIQHEIGEVVRNSKKEGNLDGFLNLDIEDSHYALHLVLDKGNYFFQNSDHNLEKFILDYDPCEFKLITKYRHQQNSFWVMLKSSSKLNNGEIIISEKKPEDADFTAESNALTINWKHDFENGFALEKLSGSLGGMNFQLLNDPAISPSKNFHFLIGEIKLNVQHASYFLSPDFHKKIQSFGMGSGYALNGNWKFSKESLLENPNISFQGKLEGKNFEFKGYQFEKMAAELEFSPDSAIFKDLKLADPSMRLSFDQLNLTKIQDKIWSIDSPKILVSECKPSLLRKAGSKPPLTSKTFLIKEIELVNLTGSLDDSQTISAKGKLNFISPPKKNFQHTIFAIPAEILTRLGLDLTVLNPVTGTIYYEIKNNKIYLTKFKDVYSEGKLSKFYLPNNSFRSYLDFNGNLNVQVKMKQYNLVFKLAELFTVTVQGNLQKPTYTLQKQHHQEVIRTDDIGIN